MFIVQFSKDDKRIRCVESALLDGYSFGDRFLEGCEFKVSVHQGKVSVEATDETADYLESVEASVKQWEARILKDLKQNGYDSLFLNGDEDPVWDGDELHLAHDTSFYVKDGFTLEE